MHIKHMHCMIEDLAEYGKCMIEAGTGSGDVNLCDAGEIVDMIKDLAEAEYYARISKAMEKAEEEGEKEPSRMYFPMDGMVPYMDRMKSGSESWRDSGSKEGMDWMDRRGDRDRMERMRKPGRSGSSESGVKGTRGRYGFSFDEYMEAREMYPGQEQEHKRMRMEALNRELDELVEMGKEVVHDMTPEEKQAWKGKISKILNM